MKSLINRNWNDAAKALNNEEHLRRKLLSFAPRKKTLWLIERARQLGCGIKFAGRGDGGCLWAIGPEVSISRFKKACQDYGQFFPLVVDREGLTVNIKHK